MTRPTTTPAVVSRRRRTVPARMRDGFTLVELLVVIAIIGMLVGLALPVLNNARKRAAQMECMSNMRNVAQATIAYELNRRQYPGFINVLMMNNGKPYSDPTTGQQRGVSYIVPLLDFLDQPVLGRAWKTPSQSGGGGDIPDREQQKELSRLVMKDLGLAPNDIASLQKMEWAKLAAAGNAAASSASVTSTSAPASARIYETSGALRKLLIGTTTPPASKIPNNTGTNSGQFFSHKPTRSPGCTPMLFCK